MIQRESPSLYLTAPQTTSGSPRQGRGLCVEGVNPVAEKHPCSACGHPILPITSQLTGGICRPCENKRRWEGAAEPSFDEGEWELAPDHAHPNARRRLTEAFFWDISDAGAALGSDIGADTLSAYQRWREQHPEETAEEFLTDFLIARGVEVIGWDVTSPEALAPLLEPHYYHIRFHDDAVIGLAFAQLVLDGVVEAAIRDEALEAINHQALDLVIEFRGWADPAQRRSRLIIMRQILKTL